MIVEYKTKAQMIKDAEKELKNFERGIVNDYWKDQGYTEQEIQNTLDLCKKEVSFLKYEISFEEYMEAYHLVHERKVV